MRYRTVWMQYEEPDPRTGRPMVKAIWPRRVPARVSRWNRQELADVLLFGTFAAVFTLAILTGLR